MIRFFGTYDRNHAKTTQRRDASPGQYATTQEAIAALESRARGPPDT